MSKKARNVNCIYINNDLCIHQYMGDVGTCDNIRYDWDVCPIRTPHKKTTKQKGEHHG